MSLKFRKAFATRCVSVYHKNVPIWIVYSSSWDIRHYTWTASCYATRISETHLYNLDNFYT